MNFAPMVVNFLGFKINVMDQASTAVIGPNQQVDIFVSVKRNQGFGEVNGDLSPIYIPITGVADPDAIDSNSVKGSVV
ncbi:hypothetical protein [Ectobacillus panaciterrae]|uniref:hypothetical protein n=1 Tax=Ectobacillus panaciterrae TaxID=363872 RepID=UPI00048E7B1E|nr:hypothetical protein [Ectobacillus panaciterrae]